MYTENLKGLEKLSEQEIKKLEDKIRTFEIHLLNLLNSEDVSWFIMSNWIYYKVVNGKGYYREYKVGEPFDTDSIINTVKYCLEDRVVYHPFITNLIHKKDIGAIKLWEEFESYGIEMQELYVYWYILAFCEFKVSNDGRLIMKPKEPEKEEITSFDQKVANSLGNALISHIIGIPGMGLLAKFEDWEARRRQDKIYNEVRSNIYINQFDEMMQLEKFKQLKKSIIQKVENTLLQNKINM